MNYINHSWINANTIENRKYQTDIAKHALDGNLLAVMPTGIGKTPIAALVAAYRLEKYPDGKILMMAPTRPLVEQHCKSFQKFIKFGPSEQVVITGTTKPEKREEMYKKSEIIFATPQTIRNDIKAGILELTDFILLIFDEAHHSVKKYAYTHIADKYMATAKNPLILGLTASPGGQRYKIDEVREKLFIKFVEIRNRDDPDVAPYVQRVDHESIFVELDDELKEIQLVLEQIKKNRIQELEKWGFRPNFLLKSEIIALQKKLSMKRSGSNYTIMSYLAEILKIDHALVLLETQCLHALKHYIEQLQDEGFSGGTKAAERLYSDVLFQQASIKVNSMIAKNKEHPKISKLEEILQESLSVYSRIMIFAQYRDTISYIHDFLKTIPGCRPVEFIGQAKKKGKGLSQKEQMRILNEFKMGFFNILIASQVGEEGIDITETDAVIFYEPVASGIRKIQRAGRTARTKQGKVMVLITKGTRDEAYYWSGYHKERKMKKIMKSMQEKNLGDFVS